MSRFHDHRARLAAALVPTMLVFASVRFGRLRGCAKALRNLSALTLIGRCRCCRGRSGCPQGHHRMNLCCCYIRCRLLTNTAKAVKVPVPRARARGTAPSGVTSISAISLSQTSTGTFTCSASRSCKRSSVTRLLCLLTAASFRRLLFMIPVMLFSAGCQTLITSV